MFINELSKKFDVTPPRILFDAPISNTAQYGRISSQIQYKDDEKLIYDLTEKGSTLPLKWTLNEFSHHILDERNKNQSESFAREFTNQLITELITEWRKTILNGEKPDISVGEDVIKFIND